MSAKATHDAVRRYLLERQRVLAEENRAIDQPVGQLPPDEARKAQAGSAAIRAAQELLAAVERRDPSEFATIAELRTFVRQTAQRLTGTAELGMDQVPLTAALEERRRLVTYVDGLGETAAEDLPPLPYRHVLTAEQRRLIFDKLRERWPPQRDRRNDSWHPYDALPGGDVLHLQTAWFDVSVSMVDFRQRVSAHTGDHLWELNEGNGGWDSDDTWRPDYELSPLWFWPGAGYETLWTWDGLDFLIYTDHNQGTYFLGSWLTGQIHELWPNWQRHIWTGVAYERPPRTWPLLFPPWAWPPGSRPG
ncbi:MAG: hypothetical protein M3069_32670 [Chloroflexota bacterium]|nr:hypothetical protein [Chloroflexota bacterium]